jgi:hypothetical protein
MRCASWALNGALAGADVRVLLPALPLRCVAAIPVFGDLLRYTISPILQGLFLPLILRVIGTHPVKAAGKAGSP